MASRRIAPDLARAGEAIQARGGSLGHPLHLLDQTTSTNDEAKRAAKAGAPHGSTWVAEVQSDGRGRQGRAWLSPPGENLLFSTLLRIHCPIDRLPLISVVAGLAVRDSIARLVPAADIKLKWPNDVVVGSTRKKLAGILVETTMTGRKVEAIIVGIGINVFTREFEADFAPFATSVAALASATKSVNEPNRACLLADVLHSLDRDVAHVAARGLGLIHARLTEADALLGQWVGHSANPTSSEEGRAEGIDTEGRLMVRRADGLLVRWSAGEVHLGLAGLSQDSPHDMRGRKSAVEDTPSLKWGINE